MSVHGNYSVIGVGNPMCDRTSVVEDTFLDDHGLKKGLNAFTADLSIINASWNDSTKNKDDYIWSVGGSATNVAKALKHFGLEKCVIYGKIGADDIGEKIKQNLTQMGITPLLSKGKQGTGIANCFVSHKNTQRTMHVYIGVANEFSPEDILKDPFPEATLVHHEGYPACFGRTLQASFSLARKNHAKISLDLASANIVENFKSTFEECVPNTDFVFGNVEEMQAFTGIKEIKEAAEHFDSHQTIVATQDASGCWVKNEVETDAVHYPALTVANVVDTTGAGDFFEAGFLYKKLKHEDIFSCVGAGHLAAIFVIRQPGTDLPESKWKDLINLMNKV